MKDFETQPTFILAWIAWNTAVSYTELLLLHVPLQYLGKRRQRIFGNFKNLVYETVESVVVVMYPNSFRTCSSIFS